MSDVTGSRAARCEKCGLDLPTIGPTIIAEWPKDEPILCGYCRATPAAKYRTIVADPPWDHSDGTGTTLGIGDTIKRPRPGGAISTGLPYSTMALSDIKALPVSGLAATDAHLYLWTTNRYVRQVWDVAEAWGFSGVRVLVWCKAPFGLKVGGAWPSTAEFCLFARRGSLAATRQAASQWFELPRRIAAPVRAGQSRNGRHSEKPEAFLDLVEMVSPGPYLELFARRNRLGWDTWGNEALGHVEVGGSA